MKNKLMFSLLVSCLVLGSPSAFSKEDGQNNKGCKLFGSYGFLYNGTSFASVGPVPLTETGSFTVDKNGVFSGEGTLAFNYPNFYDNNGPLWLLMHEELTGATPAVKYDANNPCSGTIDYTTTVTVIKSSDTNRVDVDTVLITNKPRSIAFRISGEDKKIVDLISTSPGTIASGTAHKQ